MFSFSFFIFTNRSYKQKSEHESVIISSMLFRPHTRHLNPRSGLFSSTQQISQKKLKKFEKEYHTIREQQEQQEAPIERYEVQIAELILFVYWHFWHLLSCQKQNGTFCTENVADMQIQTEKYSSTPVLYIKICKHLYMYTLHIQYIKNIMHLIKISLSIPPFKISAPHLLPFLQEKLF